MRPATSFIGVTNSVGKSADGTVTRLLAVKLGFEFRQWQEIVLFAAAFVPALRTTQPPIQWIQRFFSSGLKRSWHEADHFLPCSAKVKNVWSYTSNSLYVFMAWCLIKHRESFTFNDIHVANISILLSWVCQCSLSKMLWTEENPPVILFHSTCSTLTQLPHELLIKLSN